MDIQKTYPMGVRKFGRVNWIGVYTLTAREVTRFTSVWTQTVLAPLITAALFLAVFDLAIGVRRGEVMGVAYIAFLAPGIMMMQLMQNAFTNSASFIVSSKIQGNIIDTLMPPLSPLETTVGYATGAAIRGVTVGGIIMIMTFPFIGLGIAHPLWLAVFVLLGSYLMALVGVATGVVADRFDHMHVVSNFIVLPLTFLSGTFYSIDILPPWLNAISHLNPIFYVIDGARYGVIGQSDANPVTGALIVLTLVVALSLLCFGLFRTGFRLKS